MPRVMPCPCVSHCWAVLGRCSAWAHPPGCLWVDSLVAHITGGCVPVEPTADTVTVQMSLERVPWFKGSFCSIPLTSIENLPCFLTGITGADKFTVLRNTATRNGGFRGILDPVKDVSVSVYARVREPQRQRTAIMGSGRRQVSGCLPVEAPHK